MTKQFRIKADDIKPLATGHGGCLATDMITVEGYPVSFMYREPPDHELDSGWRFLSGFESEDYMDNAENHGAYDVNTIANYDPSIIPFLEEPEGSVFKKPAETELFVPVEDWEPRDD